MTHYVFDTDGVLADFVDQVRACLGLQHYEPQEYDLRESLTPWQRTQVLLAMLEREFWLCMRPFRGGIRALQWALKNNHEVTVVSQPPPGMPAEEFASLRSDWLLVHGGAEMPRVRVTASSEERAALPGDVLVDDNPGHVDAWRATGREAVLVKHSYNDGIVRPDMLVDFLRNL